MFEAIMQTSSRKKTSELDLESSKSDSEKSESVGTPLSKTKQIQKNYNARLCKKNKQKVGFHHL